MVDHTGKALLDADLTFFMIDGREGITSVDSHFAQWLRKLNARGSIRLIANKLEGYPDRWEDELNEFYELGMGGAIPISAEHGEGMNLLLDEIMPIAIHMEETLKKESLAKPEDGEEKGQEDEEEEVKANIKLAIIGRPNVGKVIHTSYIFSPSLTM